MSDTRKSTSLKECIHSNMWSFISGGSLEDTYTNEKELEKTVNVYIQELEEHLKLMQAKELDRHGFFQIGYNHAVSLALKFLKGEA